MTPQYPNLFSPIRLGSVTAPNRVMSSSHGTRMSEDNLVSPREIAYYAEKARGGTGIIVLDGVRVNMNSTPNRHTLLGTHPEQAARYRLLADAVHEHGALMLGQILHQGAQTGTTYSRRALVSASGIASPALREVPHALSAREIRGLIDDFVLSASLMREGGLDGVELHAAHGYLVGQFLSARTNKRTDDYGGTLENRMRFGRDLIAAVRAAVGDDWAFGIRLNADDMTPGGNTPDELMQIARTFVAAGRLDFLSISLGTYVGDGLSLMIGDYGQKPGYIAGNAQPFKAAFPNLPIVTVGRINTPELAEDIIARGDADICAIARSIIADPEWANKAKAGQAAAIRPCIACNTCLTMNRANEPITCSVNAACGEERVFGAAQQAKAAKPRRVVIVGAGPAGLEAARVAAERGHKVTLYERRAELGGQLALTAKARNRAELGRLVHYYDHELRRLGVDVRLGQDVDRAALRELNADEVIMATGAVGGVPADVPVVNTRLATAWDLLEGAGVGTARNALLIDRDHGYGAPSLAHHLADVGCAVTFVSDQPMIGPDLPPGALPGVLKRLLGAGIKVLPLHSVAGVENGTASLRHGLTGEVSRISGVDLVVIAGERRAADSLYRALDPDHGVTLVGDAVSPRQIWQAVRDGFLTGHRL